jgi:hypothetical protein
LKGHEASVQGATADSQPLKFNLGEGRGTAGLMSAWEIYAQSQGLERDEGLRNDGRRGRKGDDMSNRTRRRRAAERAVLEVRMRSRMVMPGMRGHRHLIGRGTQLQQKRRAVGRHEADRNIGSKQQYCQQKAGEPVASARMK